MSDVKSKSEPPELTLQQVRAARALLAWSQQDLAKAAKVAQSTVADFERGVRQPVPNNTAAMRNALVDAGVNFLPGGAVIGPPIPVIKGAAKGSGARLIDATDLEQWAARRDAQGTFPMLLQKLVAATIGPSEHIQFPANEAIQLPGWDGLVYSERAAGYVPSGHSGWELGVQRTAILKKAQDDYDKRTAQSEPLDPAESTFVFVTPRTWAKKDVWVKERRGEKSWKDVRAYDATDLVNWIERHPSVGLWLAVQMGKRPQGAHLLEEIWTEWSLATRWPLSEDLVLADRDQEAAELLKWLRGEPSTMALKAETADEAAAFVFATLRTLPPDLAAHYLSRSVIATNADTARSLSDGADPLIIILLDPDPGLAQRIARAGHFVILAYGDGEHAWGEVTTLPRPSREGVASGLISMGIVRDHAEVLARDSARSLAILRRLIPSVPGRLPSWAREIPPRTLLAALLAGGWSEENEADRRVLERLSGTAYREFSQSLAKYVSALDSPLRKIGETWKIASRRDAWFLLAKYLTASDLDAFQSAVVDVLGATDPRFELAPDERWMAAIDGKLPAHSPSLRRGLGETLILLAQFADRVTTSPDGVRRSQMIVRTLLKNATEERWWSLANDFRFLAEAAPEMFLTMLDESLSRNNPPILALFGFDQDPLFGSERLPDLLWAMETLAWSPKYISRGADLLARLDEIDPGGRFGNRPGRSLRSIFLSWSPQTFATYRERLKIMDSLRVKHPAAAWRLLLQILPKDHDSVSPSPPPRWLDFSEWQKESVTRRMIRTAANDVTTRVIEDAGEDADRWCELIDRIPDLGPDPSAAIARLRVITPKLRMSDGQDKLRTQLRSLISRHRSYQDAGWAMEPAELEALEEIYDGLAPVDLVARHAWLFRSDAKLPNLRKAGWTEARNQLLKERQRVALELYQTGGLGAVFSLAEQTTAPGYIGEALRQAEISADEQDMMIERALRQPEQRLHDLAFGLVSASVRERGQSWAQALVSRADTEEWGRASVLTLLKALPQQRWCWLLAESLGTDIEDQYWRDIPILWIEGGADDIAYAARKLNAAQRAHHAIHLLGEHLKLGLPTQLLVETMQQALKDNGAARNDAGNDAVMFQHFVVEILKYLDGRQDADDETLRRIEWAYLRFLEYSERQPVVLLKAMATSPEFFIDIMKMIYKPSEESGVVEGPASDPEDARKIGSQAYRLLRLWDRVPGSDDQGRIDFPALSSWVRRARLLAVEAGREGIVDQKIGEVLSASTPDPDGSWPQRAVRDLIENMRNPDIESGFSIGLYNRRGVTARGLRDGGELERSEVERYRNHAQAAELEWPRMAALLERIADDYEREAQMHDLQAEKLDWE